MADVELLDKSPHLLSSESIEAQLARENHLSDKMDEVDLDEESPLGVDDAYVFHKPTPDDDAGSPPDIDLDGSGSLDGLSHGPMAHTGTPLIIVPVQSEGIPSSGSGLPLGRPHPASPDDLPQGEELCKMLTQQLEYYFSKDNLSSDKYLLSQMDSANYVPISVLSNFNQVKRLTQDPIIILESLRASTVLQLDEMEEKVRSIPEKRLVLILREIPKETPKQELVSLFSREGCPKCVTCEFADNNCWYVTFDSEESTQQAYAFLREKVKEFQGRPIRARIKGTTVQRSSGLPKPKQHVFMPANYNGGPSPQLPYFSSISNVMPWSPTPPTSSSSSPYFDPASYNPLVGGNGFTPPQQTPPTQVAMVSQSPGGNVHQGMMPAFSNNGIRYPPFPFVNERGGSGTTITASHGNRSGPPNRSNQNRNSSGGPARVDKDCAPSPPLLNGGDVPSVGLLDKETFKSGRNVHGSSNSGGGGKYKSEDRKIPRLKNTGRHGRSDGGEKTNDKAPQRQQQPQPKLDTAHFPPLPTSGADSAVTTPPSVTLSTSHVTPNEDGQKTLSDIVKGGSRPSNAVVPPQPPPPPAIPTVNGGGSQTTLASVVVERNIPSTSVKTSTSHSQSLPAPSIGVVDTPEQVNLSSEAPLVGVSQPEKKISAVMGETGEEANAGEKIDKSGAVGTGAKLSSVVSGGGGSGGGHTYPQGGNKGVPASASQRIQRGDYRPSHNYKDRPYNNVGNKGYSRYSDRDYSNKQARNPQVFKADNRLPQNSSSARGRVKGEQLQRNRVSNGPRPTHGKPSPKSFKKQFPGHSSSAAPQAPPPPPVPASSNPATSSDGSGTATNSGKVDPGTSQSSSASQPPKKLSYAQMAQKRNSKELAEGVETSPSAPNKPQVTPSSSSSSSSAAPPTSSQTAISTTPAISTQSTSVIITTNSGTRSTTSPSAKIDVEVSPPSEPPGGGIVSKAVPSSPSKDSDSVSNKGKGV